MPLPDYNDVLSKVRAKAVRSALQRELDDPAFTHRALIEFKDLDKNADSVLDADELKVALQNSLEEAGRELKGMGKPDVRRLLAAFDEDLSGTLSFLEFLAFKQYVYVCVAVDTTDAVLHLLSTQRRAQAMKKRWEGLLATTDAPDAVKERITTKITDNKDWRRDRVNLFKKVDKDGNGKIDKKELVDVLKEVCKHAEETWSPSAEVCDAILADYDADGNGALSITEFIEMCRYLVVAKELKRVDVLSKFGVRKIVKMDPVAEIELAERAVSDNTKPNKSGTGSSSTLYMGVGIAAIALGLVFFKLRK